jgi:hypothetical protein
MDEVVRMLREASGEQEGLPKVAGTPMSEDAANRCADAAHRVNKLLIAGAYSGVQADGLPAVIADAKRRFAELTLEELADAAEGLLALNEKALTMAQLCQMLIMERLCKRDLADE